MEEFYRVRRLPPYVFEQVNRAKAAARNGGADIIDLGMGNPDLPAPAHVIEKLKETLGRPRTDRYSASKGIAGLRRGQIGIAHAEIDDIGACIACRGLGAVDLLEHIGRQTSDAVKFFHGNQSLGAKAWFRPAIPLDAE